MTAQARDSTIVTRPMSQNAVRQPVSATRAASGNVPTIDPRTPTVAEIAASVPKCDGGNHVAAILSVPMKVTVAPSPTAKRPAKSGPVFSATAIASVPSPMMAPPIAMVQRAPNASMSRPAGIIKPAYA